ncbi:hypothetical protein HOC35_01325 [Candidatus Woesearchaeota archaeon]|jgi:hypothetical protein|nr:hypothetical protein [Candidatus Woesearchaeota archaeon]
MVQVIITLIGMITILAGILPFVGNFIGIPSSVIEGIGYSILIMVIGIIGLLYGFMSMALIGVSKFMMICLGLLTVLGGIVPLIINFIPVNIPTSGPIYSGVIILIGIAGLAYGAKHF